MGKWASSYVSRTAWAQWASKGERRLVSTHCDYSDTYCVGFKWALAMAFDGQYEEADGPGKTWSEQELRRGGKDSGDAGASAEPRGREEYYEALRVASEGESSEGDGDGPKA